MMDRMRIALISDIHANVWALEAVLADVRRRGVDLIWNLGDILHGALRPRATLDLLQASGIALTIRGNQDRDLYDATPEQRAASPRLAFMLDDLGPRPLQWLRELPATAQFEDQVLLCHGSPASDLYYLLEDVSSGSPQVRGEAEILRALGNVSKPVIVCGHTHIPRLVRLSTGQLIVNPGSVGLQAYRDEHPCAHSMQTFAPDASYAILERNHDNAWSAGFYRVPYDFSEAARTAAAHGRADWACQISTGRV
jgi:putative phosphoesterase